MKIKEYKSLHRPQLNLQIAETFAELEKVVGKMTEAEMCERVCLDYHYRITIAEHHRKYPRKSNSNPD